MLSLSISRLGHQFHSIRTRTKHMNWGAGTQYSHCTVSTVKDISDTLTFFQNSDAALPISVTRRSCANYMVARQHSHSQTAPLQGSVPRSLAMLNSIAVLKYPALCRHHTARNKLNYPAERQPWSVERDRGLVYPHNYTIRLTQVLCHSRKIRATSVLTPNSTMNISLGMEWTFTRQIVLAPPPNSFQHGLHTFVNFRLSEQNSSNKDFQAINI